MEFLVCCVFAYWLVKHIPQIAGETAEAIAAAWNGQESPALKARRDRLDAAGIDPAHGGAFGQWWGNLWRDFWLDQDKARGRRRDQKPHGDGESGKQSWFDKVRDWFDDEVDRRNRKWRTRRAGHGFDDEKFGSNADDYDSDSGGYRHGPEPGEAHPLFGEDEETPRPEGDQEPTPRPEPDAFNPDTSTWPDPEPNSPPQPDPQTSTEPVHVPSTVGEPVPDSTAHPAAELEGTTMSQAVSTNGTAVTGVVSGAAEARAIQRYLEQATAAYDGAMAQARKRIHALGEQTVGVVQLATKSDVVDATAQAAESIAAAQAGANTCKAETIPLLGLVARHFDRRNS
uniref:hypothetical protein n=1 Tax=Paractinoplanes polyasparticus TaxID=2856853 RepID=UPI001C85DC89|nr:hypothetical protein [Actinoplanes polyasparticus]